MFQQEDVRVMLPEQDDVRYCPVVQVKIRHVNTLRGVRSQGWDPARSVVVASRVSGLFNGALLSLGRPRYARSTTGR